MPHAAADLEADCYDDTRTRRTSAPNHNLHGFCIHMKLHFAVSFSTAINWFLKSFALHSEPIHQMHSYEDVIFDLQMPQFSGRPTRSLPYRGGRGWVALIHLVLVREEPSVRLVLCPNRTSCVTTIFSICLYYGMQQVAARGWTFSRRAT